MTHWLIETPQSQADIDALNVFCKQIHGDHPAIFDAIFYHNPCVPRESHYFIRQDGQIVAMVSLLPRQQFWAGKFIPTAEIGLVGTHPDWRNQGLSRYLMHHCLTMSNQLGYQWLFLYGIPRFYEQFDFAHAFPSYHPRVEITLDKLTNWPTDQMAAYRIRSYQSKDLPGLMTCYRQAFKDTPGAIERPADYWNYQLTALAQTRYECDVLLNMRGEVKGYSWWEQHPQWKVVEAVSPDHGGSMALLRAAQSRLLRTKQTVLGWQIPQDHRLAQDIFEWGGCFYSPYSIYAGVWAGMVRLLNWKALLHQALPIFNQRLQQSRWYDWTGSLVLGCGTASCQLDFKGGEISIGATQTGPDVCLNLAQWGPLLLGYQGWNIQVNNLPYPKSAICQILFPRQFPFMSEIDSYG